MHTYTRSFNDRPFVAWRSPNSFTNNPDIIKLPSGRLGVATHILRGESQGHYAYGY